MSRHHEAIKNDPRWKRARRDCLDRDDDTCQQCGADEDLTVDHVLPLDLGGEPFELDNLLTLCRPCNSRKGNRINGKTKRETWISPRYSEILPFVSSRAF